MHVQQNFKNINLKVLNTVDEAFIKYKNVTFKNDMRREFNLPNLRYNWLACEVDNK